MIGGDGSREVKAGIERQTVPGKIERRKLFDVADDDFIYVTRVEQNLVGMESGKDFMFLRVRVKRVRPRRNSFAASFYQYSLYLPTICRADFW